jgi:hypothetical protein
MKNAALFFIVPFLFGVVYSGTVTLTGACTQQSGNGLVIFNLSNSGNSTASAISVILNLPWHNNFENYSAGSIDPGQALRFNAMISAPQSNGSYVSYFDVDYSQSSSEFSAVFPCLLKYGSNAPNNITLSYQIHSSGYDYTVNVYAHNIGASAINDNISLILPSGFSYSSPKYVRLTISPFTTANASFQLSSAVEGSYSGAIVSNYNSDGINYAAMTGISIVSTASSGNGYNFIDLFYAFLIIVILLMLMLILRAIIIKKSKS